MKFGLKKSLALAALLLAGATTLTACGGGDSSSGGSGEKGYVGIAMPTKSAERWIADGNNMVEELEKLDTKQICNMERIK